MPLGSSRLAAGVLASGGTLIYTAPPGSSVKIQAVVVSSPSGNLNFSIAVLPSGTTTPGASDPYLIRNKLLIQYDTFILSWGQIVLGSEETLWMKAESGAMDVSVFGEVQR